MEQLRGNLKLWRSAVEEYLALARFTTGVASVNDESDERFRSGAMKGVDRFGTLSRVEEKPEIA